MSKNSLANDAYDPADEDTGAHHERVFAGVLSNINSPRARKTAGAFADDVDGLAGDFSRVAATVGHAIVFVRT
jgi:hypothetical protein